MMGTGSGHHQKNGAVSMEGRSAVVTLTMLFLSVWVLTGVTAQRKTNKRSEMLTDLIGRIQGKSNNVPPNFDSDQPTYVQCQIYVDSFDSISEASMDFTVSLMLALTWTHKDLQYKDIYDVEFFEIDNENMQKVWIPDLYFPNEKKASFHQVMGPNQVMKLYPDGQLEYFARLSLTLSCPMNLRNYPFDRQECTLKIGSFGFDSDKLMLEWSTDDNPVDVNTEIELPQFQVVGYESRACETKDVSRIGNHSCLEATFHLERSLQYYLIQMYIPSTLIVIVSWLSFWLTVGSVAGRISLGVLTVLTMTTQSSAVNASLPRVSYLKAIDLWMSTCLVFVFAALLEFAIVNVLSRRKDKGVAQGQGQGTPPPHFPHNRSLENGPSTSSPFYTRSMDTLDGASQDLDLERGTLIKQTLVDMDGRTRLAGGQADDYGDGKKKKKKPWACCSAITVAILMDRVSRVIFPFLFASFCASYWTYYAFFTETSLSISSMESDNETEPLFDL
ncbi:glycine receptor subunit alpha-4-like [Babylonia areolata]|uniref:glycine receptor subunit alpha-4-like n=1 Tax=Babylonia areolata TaxID=304850 RepID=UPI003FD59165